VLLLSSSQFSEAHLNWRYFMDVGKQQFVGNCAIFVVRGNFSLTINVALSDTVKLYNAVVRTQ
jgi:hypothetical protein